MLSLIPSLSQFLKRQQSVFREECSKWEAVSQQGEELSVREQSWCAT